MGRRSRAVLPTSILALALSACPTATDADDAPGDADATLVCDRDYLDVLDALIDGAQDELRAAQWVLFGSLTTDLVIEMLAAAAARGVDVRVLLDETIDDNRAP